MQVQDNSKQQITKNELIGQLDDDDERVFNQLLSGTSAMRSFPNKSEEVSKRQSRCYSVCSISCIPIPLHVEARRATAAAPPMPKRRRPAFSEKPKSGATRSNPRATMPS